MEFERLQGRRALAGGEAGDWHGRHGDHRLRRRALRLGDRRQDLGEQAGVVDVERGRAQPAVILAARLHLARFVADAVQHQRQRHARFAAQAHFELAERQHLGGGVEAIVEREVDRHFRHAVGGERGGQGVVARHAFDLELGEARQLVIRGALLQAVEVQLVDGHLVDLDRAVLVARRRIARDHGHHVVQHEARRAQRRGAAIGEFLHLELGLDIAFEALQAVLRRRAGREPPKNQPKKGRTH